MTEVKMYIGDLVGGIGSLSVLCDRRFNAVTAWKLQKVYRPVKAEFDVYEKTREKLVRQYGELDEKEKRIVVPLVKEEEFNAELLKLLEQEVIISIPLITIEQLSDGLLEEDGGFKPRELADVWFIFEGADEVDLDEEV